jgi:hypothetical protein
MCCAGSVVNDEIEAIDAKRDRDVRAATIRMRIHAIWRRFMWAGLL